MEWKKVESRFFFIIRPICLGILNNKGRNNMREYKYKCCQFLPDFHILAVKLRSVSRRREQEITLSLHVSRPDCSRQSQRVISYIYILWKKKSWGYFPSATLKFFLSSSLNPLPSPQERRGRWAPTLGWGPIYPVQGREDFPDVKTWEMWIVSLPWWMQQFQEGRVAEKTKIGKMGQAPVWMQFSCSRQMPA